MGLCFSRLFLPMLAFLAGSWVGMGKPPAEDMLRAAKPYAARAFHFVREQLERHTSAPRLHVLEPVAVEDDPSPVTVDPEHMPDPTPWPRLNPEASLGRAWLLADGPARHLEEPHRLVTLTFDDGPFPETTPEVLKILARHGVKATFFFVGRYMDGSDLWAARSRETARMVAREGHRIGNHTHDHVILTAVSRTAALAQIDEGARTIERVTGIRPVFFRPPYGQLDAWGERALQRRGLELTLWSVEVGDMKSTDVDEMVERLKSQLDFAGGGVVLLHDIRPSSVEVLAKLLRWLGAHKWDPNEPEKKGYEIVDLVRYMRATAAAPPPFASRAELERARHDEWKALHPRHRAPERVIFSEGHDPVL